MTPGQYTQTNSGDRVVGRKWCNLHEHSRYDAGRGYDLAHCASNVLLVHRRRINPVLLPPSRDLEFRVFDECRAWRSVANVNPLIPFITSFLLTWIHIFSELCVKKNKRHETADIGIEGGRVIPVRVKPSVPMFSQWLRS